MATANYPVHVQYMYVRHVPTCW